MQGITPHNEAALNAIIETISKPRLSKYLAEAQGNVDHALQLYRWNAQLSQALYLSLQGWEISLRNKLNGFLIYKYDSDWPYNTKAVRNLTKKDSVRLEEVIRRQSDHRAITKPNTNHIVADLSAGFWVSQLGKSYDIPYGWRSNLKWRVFVNEQNLTRGDAAEICDDLLELRNRIAHHEPIFHLDLAGLKSDLDYLLNAMCTGTAAYASSNCSFSETWKNRPKAPNHQ